MTITPSDINSGNEQLDKDLAELLNMGSPQEAKDLVDSIISSGEENIVVILDQIPTGAIRIAMAFHSTGVDSFFENVHPRAHDFVKQGAKIAQAIEGIITYEPVRKQLVKERTGDNKNTLATAINIVNSMNGNGTWYVSDEFLVPAVRIAFMDSKRDRLLLDTTGDWDDILYMIATLSELVNRDISKALFFAEKGMHKNIKIDTDGVPDKIEKAKKMIAEIEHNYSTLLNLINE